MAGNLKSVTSRRARRRRRLESPEDHAKRLAHLDRERERYRRRVASGNLDRRRNGRHALPTTEEGWQALWDKLLVLGAAGGGQGDPFDESPRAERRRRREEAREAVEPFVVTVERSMLRDIRAMFRGELRKWLLGVVQLWVPTRYAPKRRRKRKRAG